MKKNHGFPYKWGIKMRYVLLVLGRFNWQLQN